MIHEHCTHPPYAVIFDHAITPSQHEKMVAVMRSEGFDAARPVILSEGGRIEVVECSWCRNAAAAGLDLDGEQ